MLLFIKHKINRKFTICFYNVFFAKKDNLMVKM